MNFVYCYYWLQQMRTYECSTGCCVIVGSSYIVGGGGGSAVVVVVAVFPLLELRPVLKQVIFCSCG